MKFRVAREVLADAVAWTARSLPPRPSVPVLAGILLEADGSQLSVSGFDYEVSARAEIDVQTSESGRVLVPGRLLAEITRALPPHPVDITAEGWVRPGDEPGVDGGQQVEGRRRRCTTVDLSTCRQQEDADRPQRANTPLRPLTCGKGPVPQLPHV